MENLTELYVDKKKQKIIIDNVDWENINSTKKNIINKKEIELLFSSFKYPIMLQSKEENRFTIDPRKVLYIWCDNSLPEIDNNLSIIIDHHKYETLYPDNFDYTSNCDLIMRNFLNIYYYLKNYLNCLDMEFQKIIIFMHTDMDGIFSGLMIKYIINLIYDKIEINKDNYKNYTRDIILPYVLGELGDISINIEKIVNKKLKQFDIVKLKSFQKYCNRLFKGFKSFINIDIMELNEDKTFKYNELEYRVLRYILYLCNSDTILNESYFYYLINCLETNKDCLQLVSNVSFEITNYTKQIEELSLPMVVNFTGFETDYYFFTVTSDYDIGRSIMWAFKLTYSKKISFKNKGICFYNNKLNKLSLHSFNDDSSYNISKELFNGGGHILKDGSALGSCECNDLKKIFENIKIKNVKFS